MSTSSAIERTDRSAGGVSRFADARRRLAARRGDVVGGISAAIVSLPIDINYGLIAVAPLGPRYAYLGVLAAIYTAILAVPAATFAGVRPGQIVGSRPALSLVLASLFGRLLDIPSVANDLSAMLLLATLCVFLAGAMQFGFGLLGLGRAIKYIPYPVLAGFVNGVAVLILLAALPVTLGLDTLPKWGSLATALHAVQPLTFAVALLTVAVAMFWPRLDRRLPPTLAALIVGTTAYYLVATVFGDAPLGRTLGTIPVEWPRLALAGAAGQLFPPQFTEFVGLVLPYAATLAVLASLESLMVAAAIDGLTHSRHDSNRELLALGVGNMVAGCCGGTPNASTLSRATIIHRSGGRSRFSGYAYAATVGLVLLFAADWLARLPLVVVAAILVAIAWGMVDDWTRRLGRQLICGRRVLPAEEWRQLAASFAVMATVMTIAIVGNLVLAVLVGVVAAMFIFIRSNSKPVIRRVASGDCRHSRKVRTGSQMDYLKQNGQQIAVIEAEGVLFFGTADRLARELENAAGTARCLILDLRRVSSIDATAARILEQMAIRLRGRRLHFFLSHLTPETRVGRFLVAAGHPAALPRHDWYPDTDHALEAAEEIVLADTGAGGDVIEKLGLAATELARGLDPAEIGILYSHMVETRFASGSHVFRHGDTCRSLFVAIDSAVDIRLPLATGYASRIAAFEPGVVFGEMALLENKPRSADAVVTGETTVLELSQENFRAIQEAHPALAAKLLFNLSSSLAQRLRETTLDLRAAVEG